MMRLLRALAHLALVLAFVAGAVVQARAVEVPAAMSGQHDHHAMAAAAEHVASGHGTSRHEQPAHTRDGCQTACCFAPMQLPAAAPVASSVGFFSAVRYGVLDEFASGRACAPEPGVPKTLS